MERQYYDDEEMAMWDNPAEYFGYETQPAVVQSEPEAFGGQPSKSMAPVSSVEQFNNKYAPVGKYEQPDMITSILGKRVFGIDPSVQATRDYWAANRAPIMNIMADKQAGKLSTEDAIKAMAGFGMADTDKLAMQWANERPTAKTDYQRFVENPELFKQYKQAGRAPDKITRSAGFKAARDMGLAPGSKEFKAYADKINMKSGVTITNPTKPISAAEAAKMVDKNGNKVNIPVGMTHEQANALGYRYAQSDATSAKNSAFLGGMENAEANIALNKEMYPDFEPSDTIDAVIRGVSAGGGTIGNVIGKLQSDASKAYMTSSMEWVASNRGYLSGAAVPEIEVMRDLQTYFGQAGDSPEILALKAQMRKARMEDLGATVGDASKSGHSKLRQTADADYRKLIKAKKDLKSGPPGADHDAYEYRQKEDGTWQRRAK